MRLKIYLLTVLFSIAAIIYVPVYVSAQQKDNGYKDMAVEVLRYVNEHRVSMGLKPLIMNDIISKGAEEHSKNMASGKIPFSHDRLDERVTEISKRLKQETTSWAENVATGQHNAKAAFDSWLKSTGHRENMEGNYNMTGIGIAKSADGTLFFTEIFIYKSL